MDTNPYAGLVALVRRQSSDAGPAGDSAGAGLGAAPARMRLGRVAATAPLTVRVAGSIQPPGTLKINERLTLGARWKTKLTSPSGNYRDLTGPIAGPVSTPHGAGTLSELTGGQVHSRDTVIDKTVVEQLELDLDVGDTVLLLTEDDQVFYIIMKVVDAV